MPRINRVLHLIQIARFEAECYFSFLIVFNFIDLRERNVDFVVPLIYTSLG